MAKVYIVDLTEEERASLLKLIRSGEHPARKLNRARALPLANEGRTDPEIAEALHTSIPTVQWTRQRFVEGGLERALNEHPRLGSKKKLDGKGEAVLIALARSQPPAGRKRWTLHLLADKLVELRVVDDIPYETVRRGLKNKLTLGVRKRWCIPPLARSSSGGWRMFWACTPSPTTPDGRWSASTRRWCN